MSATRPRIADADRLGGVLAAALERARASTVDAEGETRVASEWEQLALDPFALIDAERMVIDSRDFGGRVPFVMFDYQRETLAEWMNLEMLRAERRLEFRDVHVEKSRQMGESWAVAYAVWWALVFHDVQGLTLSQKSKDVDDGGKSSTWRSLHGKVRYLHENAPAWIRARAPLDFTQGPPAFIRSAIHPDSAFILGESQTADPGRGGTFKLALIDEAARVRWDDQVMQAVDRSCPNGKMLVSTPNGVGNQFYRIRKRRSRAWRYLRIHWSRHPLYSVGLHVSGEQAETCAACRLTLEAVERGADPAIVEGAHRSLGRLVSPWYDTAVEDMTDEAIAEEIDIDYTASLPARVYREWDEQRHVVRGRVALDEALPVELAFDYGLDVNAVLICQDAPTEYRVIGELETTDSTPDQVAEGIRGVLAQLGAHELMRRPGWTRTYLCVGDPAGEARSLTTGRSVVQDYAAHGFNIVSAQRSVASTITAVKRLLRNHPKPLVVAGDQCPDFVVHAGANRWPVDSSGNRRPGSTLPLDDEHNHAMRAFAYLVSHKFPPPTRDDEGVSPGSLAEEDAVMTGDSLSYGDTL